MVKWLQSLLCLSDGQWDPTYWKVCAFFSKYIVTYSYVYVGGFLNKEINAMLVAFVL